MARWPVARLAGGPLAGGPAGPVAGGRWPADRWPVTGWPVRRGAGEHNAHVPLLARASDAPPPWLTYGAILVGGMLG
ncbi:MAG: hypothetical protein MUD13_12065, partial [Candidatus Nanopelagicales bacterium]|nr:hypothetical protein [Candidatus Nanopelagicales bacterium]